MIELILKEITEEEYNPNKDDNIKKGCYNEGHGILYQIDNPPDYYKYYKIVGRKYFYLMSSALFDKLCEASIINKKRKIIMKECKYRVSVQGLSNGIFICNLLNSPVYCPTDDTKCFNTLNIEEE